MSWESDNHLVPVYKLNQAEDRNRLCEHRINELEANLEDSMDRTNRLERRAAIAEAEAERLREATGGYSGYGNLTAYEVTAKIENLEAEVNRLLRKNERACVYMMKIDGEITTLRARLEAAKRVISIVRTGIRPGGGSIMIVELPRREWEDYLKGERDE